MRAEQRDPTLQRRVTANQQWEEPMPEAKPYDIPKQLVWEAYQRVKANRGAAGHIIADSWRCWTRMGRCRFFRHFAHRGHCTGKPTFGRYRPNHALTLP